MRDFRSTIAIVACIAFYLGYTYYLQSKYPDYGKLPPPVPTDVVNKPVTVDTPTPPPSSASQFEKQSVENSKLSLSTEDGKISRLLLKNYTESIDKGAPTVNLADHPFEILPVNAMKLVAQQSLQKADDKTLVWTSVEAGWSYQTRLSLVDDRYQATLNVTATNVSDKSQNIDLGAGLRKFYKTEATSSGLIPSASSYRKRHLLVGVNGSRQSEDLDSFCTSDEAAKTLDLADVNVDFAGVDIHYFLLSLIPASLPQSTQVWRSAAVKTGELCEVNVALQQKQGSVKPSESATLTYTLYFGPKDVEVMGTVSEKLHEAVDFGWFGLIGHPLLVAIKAIEANLTRNYGLAIVILTLLLKIAFYPLTRAAAVSMKSMQKYTPEINRIKEKYKDDKVAQQREMMAFMGKHKINPAKGCLPILPQIPVFIAFYNVLSQSIELRHAPFFGWIQDLSASDPYYITPVLLGAGMVLQQKLTPNPTMDKTQEKIMLIVPAVFTFMMLGLPAGMVIYMLTNTVVSIAQQQWLNRTIKV